MIKIIVAGLVCAAGFHAAAACAESGEMWEITIKTKLSSMQQDAPSATLKVCLPKGSALGPRNVTPNRGCKITDVKTLGSKTTWQVHCGHDGTTLSGNGEIIAGPHSYHGVTHLSGTSNGRTVHMTTYFMSRNLDKSCDVPQPSRRSGKSLKMTKRQPGRTSSPSATMAIGSNEMLAQHN